MLHILRALTTLMVFGAVAAAQETTSPPPHPINFEAAYADGVNAYVAHRYLLAEQSLELAVTARNDAAAWMFKGLSERALGKHAEAQESVHMASSLLAGGGGTTVSLDRAMERIQGPFRLYLDDVERYYVRTHLTPGEVIAGAAAPLVPAAPDRIAPEEAPPAIPVVPPKPYSPAPPAPAPEDPAAPPAPAPAPTPLPGEPLRVTAAKPVAVAEDSPGVPAVIAGAPVYPLPGMVYGWGGSPSPVSTDLIAPVPVHACCAPGGAWLPATSYCWGGYPWWNGYAYAAAGWW